MRYASVLAFAAFRRPFSRGATLALALAGCLLWSAVPADAQVWVGPASIKLQVLDDDEEPVANAQVRLLYFEVEPPEGPPALLTDSEGYAEVVQLAEGRWRVDIEAGELAPYVAVVRVNAGERPDVIAGPIRGATGKPMEVEYEKPPRRRSSPPPRPRPIPLPAPVPPPTPAPQPEPVAPPPVEAQQPEQPSPPVETQPEQPAEELPPAVETQPEQPSVPEPVASPASEAESEARETEAPETEDSETEDSETEAPEAAIPDAVTPETPEATTPAPATSTPTAPAAESPAAESVEEEASGAAAAAEPVAEEPAPAPTPAPAPVPVTPDPPAQTTPAPQPAAPPAEPAPAPVRNYRWELQSFTQPACPGCKAGEWALTLEQPVGLDGERCPRRLGDLKETLEPLVEALAQRGTLRRPTPLRDVLNLASVPALAPYLEGAQGCQLFAVALPEATPFVGYRYAAFEDGNGADCQAAETCPIGDAAWSGHPEILKAEGVTVVWTLLENRSRAQERRGLFIVYFRPPSGWSP
ncbi:MAG: hypothetical protein AAGD01_15860 [Acidobacteriota bacterium]